jgi:hypothetical protein
MNQDPSLAEQREAEDGDPDIWRHSPVAGQFQK